MKSQFNGYEHLTDDELFRLFGGKPQHPEWNRQTGEKYGLEHDLWSVYAYGNEIRVIYYKTVTRHRTAEQVQAIVEARKKSAERLEREKADYRLQWLKDKIDGKPVDRPPEKPPADDRLRQSISRSRARVFELMACNEFTHFGTLTVDKMNYDRNDLQAIRKDLAQMVRNLNRNREIPIKYCLIPEKHKKGGWHLHGGFIGLTDSDLRLFTLSERLPNRIRNMIKDGLAVSEWTAFRKRFGFCTFTPIRDRTATAKYVTKYITKDLAKTARESGAHLFFASQGLKGRETVVKYADGRPPVDDWDFENDYIKVKTLYL